ncbi:MAG: uroporphyrinogen-III synthase [Burkholderiaceae bacterium]
MVTCLLTQPVPRLAALCDEIRAAGLVAVPLAFSRLELIESAAGRLADLNFEAFDKIIFVSPSAVLFARDAIAQMVAARRPHIAVIGAGTAAALNTAHAGVSALQPPDPPYDADHLSAIAEMAPGKNEAMLVVRGERGRDDWIENFRGAGVAMTVVALYRTRAIDPDASAVASVMGLAGSDSKALTLVSSMGLAERLLTWQPPDESVNPGVSSQAVIDWLRRQPAMVSHPRVAKRLTDGGFDSTILPAGQQSLVSAAIQWAHENA